MAGKKFNEVVDRIREVFDDFIEVVNQPTDPGAQNTLFYYDFSFGIKPKYTDGDGKNVHTFELSIRISVNYHQFICNTHIFSIEYLLMQNIAPSIAVQIMKDEFASRFERQFNAMLINGIVSNNSSAVVPNRNNSLESHGIVELSELIKYVRG